MGIVDRLRRAAGGLIGEGASVGGEGDIVLGPQVCGSLEEGSAREWLVADGCGGYAMGTVSGLRTRRYHGLLVTSGVTTGQRRLGLASLDAVLVVGDRRYPLATGEWADGTVDPAGHRLLAAFALDRGVPRWQWRVGGVVVEREVATVHGRPAVAVVHRVVGSPRPVRLELTAMCADRDQHAAQVATAAGLAQEPVDGGCVVAGWYRLHGPGFEPLGRWHRGARLREEVARGEDGAVEDLWAAGRFQADLMAGEAVSVLAWAGDLDVAPPAGEEVVRAARTRWRSVTSSATDDADALLLAAADQFVVQRPAGPGIVAGYPWFGEWGRDTYLGLEGLLLATGRAAEARQVLVAGAASLSEGMVANTTDSGEAAHNTVDGTLWFVQAAGAYVERTGDHDLAAELAPLLDEVVEAHVAGTRHGIRVTDDGLLSQGEEGLALTWMDAVTDGHCHTPRPGKPVEVQALWINALGTIRVLNDLVNRDPDRWGLLEDQARSSFSERFAGDTQRPYPPDVVDGPGGAETGLRPNLLLAASLPHGPGLPAAAVAACRDSLLTPLGLRTLAPDEPGYVGAHRGSRAARDAAYHQGTVWPWLLGPYVDACVATSTACPAVLDGVEAHLGEVGLGSLSETADGDAPHGATGCPFQAWSVAEVLRVRRRWIDRLRG